MTAAATPRPWRIALTDDTAILGAEGTEVAFMCGEYDDEWPRMDADAVLIVRSVNERDDMLAALKAVEKALLHDAAPPFDPRNDNRIYQLDGGILGNALNKVRAAIAKAEGGTP